MVVVVVITVLTGALLLWALYSEQVAPPARPSYAPAWDGLPAPDQILRRDFPVALAGYEPLAVDAHLRAVARAYTALLEEVATRPSPPVQAPPVPAADPDGGVDADPAPPAPPGAGG